MTELFRCFRRVFFWGGGALDVAEDLFGAAKDGGVMVFIVEVFILFIVKARAGHVVSIPSYLSLPVNANRI